MSDAAENLGAPPVAIVVSRYHGEVTGRMAEGARDAYLESGGREGDLAVIDAPGSFELVSICAEAASCGLFDGVVALGCVVKGETDHDQHINSAVANGLAQIASGTGVPVAFGVLTVGSMDQALARAGGEKGNKGSEAMMATLDAVRAISSLRAAGETGDISSVSSTISRTIDKLGGAS